MKSIAKITFFSLIQLIFSASDSFAQCTPAASLPSAGIFPDSFANATVHVSYNQVIQFMVNTDTVFTGVPAKIDSLRILNVIGLPAGFTYQCNKPACNVNGGEVGCASLGGTTSQAGLFPLKVAIQVKGRIDILGSWIAAPTQYDTNSNYSIRVINPAAGVFEVVDRTRPLYIYPNPARQRLYIDAKQVLTDRASLSIVDLNGRVVHQETIDVYANPSVDISALEAGLYYVEVNNGSMIYRSKFMRQ
jgi:hypothetical protein